MVLVSRGENGGFCISPRKGIFQAPLGHGRRVGVLSHRHRTADGIQRLDLKVTTTGDNEHKAEETLTVVLRQPCNGGASTAGANPCA